MRSPHRMGWYWLCLLLLAGSGCCSVQGTSPCGSSCGCGSCGMGPLAGFRSCAGGCGETYVDEWVSEPPCIDKCCAGDPRPVRSLLQTLWGSRFVQGCDMCGGGGCDSCSSCDGGCDSGACAGGCGYTSAGGSGCTSCGGDGYVSGGSTCSSCGGGQTVTEPMMSSSAQHMPSRQGQAVYAHQGQTMQAGGEPRMVPGSFKISQPRRVSANVASERLNPARQKIDAMRASYTPN